MRNINKNIRDLRIRKGLTQDELAQQLFVTRQPVFFALLGWTLTQGIAVLAKAKQPQFPAGKWICFSLACITILWILLLMGMISGWLSIPQPLYRPCYIAFIYAVKYPWLLLFPGIGIWLCGFPHKRT